MTISHFCKISGPACYNALMKSKVLQNKEEKKEKLLAAAFYLMTHKDIQDISIAELAKEAGIAKGTFYLYFKDKYDLRDFLVSIESQKILQNAQNELDRNDIRDFEDSIIFLINHILLQLQNNPVLLNFIKHNLSWGLFNNRVSQSIETNAFHLNTEFKDHAASCGYVFDNPDNILFMILELTSAVCYNAILFNTPAPIEQMKPCLFDSIRAILSQGRRTPESSD